MTDSDAPTPFYEVWNDCLRMAEEMLAAAAEEAGQTLDGVRGQPHDHRRLDDFDWKLEMRDVVLARAVLRATGAYLLVAATHELTRDEKFTLMWDDGQEVTLSVTQEELAQFPSPDYTLHLVALVAQRGCRARDTRT